MMKKAVSGILAAIMILVLASCNAQSSSSQASSASSKAGTAEKKTYGNITFPLSDEPTELTVWTEQQNENAITDFATNKQTLWYEDMTNVHINWIAVPTAERDTKLNLSLASGSYPDIYGGMFSVNEAALYGGKVFRSLNDQLNDGSMPNTAAWFKEEPNLQKALTSPDGNLYGFPFVTIEYHMRAQDKMYVKQAWLDQLGISAPTTTEEFKNMLIAFRDNDMDGDGDTANEIPLLGSTSSWTGDPLPYLMSSFQLCPDGYVMANDNKVVFTANMDTWRSGLQYMNDLYKEGLFAEETYVQDDTQYQALVGEGIVGTATGIWQGLFCDNVAAPYTDYTVLLPLKGPTGLQQTATEAVNGINSMKFMGVITTSCQNPDLAAKWMDFWLSEEGSFVGEFGFEHFDFEYSDKTAINGKTPSVRRLPESDQSKNTMWLNSTVPGHLTEDLYYLNEASEGTGAMLLYQSGQDYIPYEVYTGKPLTSWSSDVDSEAKRSELETVIGDYVDQATAEFVLGTRDINNDSDWKTYCDELKNLGVDQYVELTQNLWFGK